MVTFQLVVSVNLFMGLGIPRARQSVPDAFHHYGRVSV